MKKDFLSVSDFSPQEIEQVIEQAMIFKEGDSPYLLSGRILALVFEKPSLRTRVSFEIAMQQLGGYAIYLSPQEVGLGNRESVPDVAKVLSRYVDCVTARTFSHETLISLAKHSQVPVINALSDLEHPCQALSDLLTIYEKKGRLAGLTMAFVGDGNNVANSLLLATSLTGMSFHIASPSGYQINQEILGQGRKFASSSRSEIKLFSSPEEAVTSADIVYTDVWTSMGQDAEADKRRLVFHDYKVDERLLSFTKQDVLFMHPLPAHHGEEISPGLLDDPRSVVFDQAENRLHLQKALLAKILLQTESSG